MNLDALWKMTKTVNRADCTSFLPKCKESPARLAPAILFTQFYKPTSPFLELRFLSRTHDNPLVSKEETDCREPNKQINDILDRRPCADEELDNVPIAAHPRTKCNKTPVKAADNYEDE